MSSYRTYLPTLFKVLKFMCAFLARHRERIIQVIGAEHTNKVDALETACDALTEVIFPILFPE